MRPTLYLDQYELPCNRLRVNARLEIADEELGGDSSSTEVAETGFKPKSLDITLQIPMRQADQLQQLREMAEATQADGARVIYTITHPLAASYGITRVRFSGAVEAREAARVHAWNVSIQLKEVESVAEQNERVQAWQAATVGPATPGTETPQPPAPDSAAQQAQQNAEAQAEDTSLFGILGRVADRIGQNIDDFNEGEL